MPAAVSNLRARDSCLNSTVVNQAHQSLASAWNALYSLTIQQIDQFTTSGSTRQYGHSIFRLQAFDEWRITPGALVNLEREFPLRMDREALRQCLFQMLVSRYVRSGNKPRQMRAAAFLDSVREIVGEDAKDPYRAVGKWHEDRPTATAGNTDPVNEIHSLVTVRIADPTAEEAQASVYLVEFWESEPTYLRAHSDLILFGGVDQVDFGHYQAVVDYRYRNHVKTWQFIGMNEQCVLLRWVELVRVGALPDSEGLVSDLGDYMVCRKYASCPATGTKVSESRTPITPYSLIYAQYLRPDNVSYGAPISCHRGFSSLFVPACDLQDWSNELHQQLNQQPT